MALVSEQNVKTKRSDTVLFQLYLPLHPSMQQVQNQSISLDKLEVGRKGIIYAHQAGNLEQILMEMGCIPGEEILVEMIAPLGDPMAVSIAGYRLGIRKAHAAQIEVNLLP